MQLHHVLIYASLALWVAGTLSAADPAPPASRKQPVTDVYHGVTVTDDYRWLEDATSAETRQWTEAQNGYARRYLDALPARQALAGELQKLMTYPSARYSDLVLRRGTLFALLTQPPKQQAMVVSLQSVDAPTSARAIVDPNALDAGGHTAVDFFVPSTDGKYVAASLSHGGSESGDVHVFETATGKALADVIPRVNGGTAGGGVAWNADSSGFYYTRYPRPGERVAADLDFYQQVWFHRLGTDGKQDTYSIGKDFPRIAEVALKSSEDGRYTLATVANGDGGDFELFLLGPDGQWIKIAGFADRITHGEFGTDGALYLLSLQNAPMGKLVRIPLTAPQLSAAQTVVPETKVVIEQFLPAKEHLYVADLVGGPSQIRMFDRNGRLEKTVPMAPVSSLLELAQDKTGNLLFQTVSYTQPRAWQRFDAGSGKVTATALKETSAADFSDVEVIRETATSKDGTAVPMTILRRKGTKLDGQNPALLYGYGGYSISRKPNFIPYLRPLLDRGVVWVEANLRGGGEFGEAWHRAGNLTRKQNVFDDFAACAQFLIDRKYTTPARLAIEGGSNGGLLMGAELTQHPELFKAVVSHVGIYDMLRVELSPNGAFNVTEFGTVKELDEFRALYAYSPYHHVRDGAQYPAILFQTGANDPRVDPANSRKMTARLQATGTRQPVLLVTSSTSGHGIGTALSERVAQQVDVEAFLFAEWGIR
ncbi:MAG: prolyl oligopeptidase family serine peptidase [Acidobacteriia bacterium]|nr:prolyl oligopeptidase family serine peptidase [Terriglobia bacterium]